MKRLFALLLLAAAAACGGTTEPPPPPPPPPGAPTVSVGSNGSVPLGSSFRLATTFTDTSSGSAPWSYGVDWGDGQNSSGSKSSISPITDAHSYENTGTYRVTITVTNHHGAAGSGTLNATITDPVILAAGDIGDCTRPGDEATAAVLDGQVGVVIPLGDNAYDNGTATEYANCYGATWGRQKARTKPVPGNHDYNTPGATGYYGYFGSAAGDPAKGYYTYTLGSWFVVVLNTGTEKPDSLKAGSTQEQWLRNELATHTQQCTLVLFHHPRFTSVMDRPWLRPEVKAIWDALYQYGADLVLNGHDHTYQRFAPQTPDGVADNAFGVRQITVGTGGGETLYQFGPTVDNLQVRDNQTHGVLKVTLRAGGYDWRFLPVAGQTFTDTGSGNCHGRPS